MSEASAGKRPGRGAVQARECSQSGEEREPKQGPGSFPRSVSTVSTAHNAYNTFLPRPTYLGIIGGLKRTASVMPLRAFSCQLNLLYLPLAQRVIVRWLRRYFDQVASTEC